MEPKKILFHLLLTTATIYLLAKYNLIPGLLISGVYSALIVASLMGLLGIAARTILVTIRVPVILLTLWLSTLILNALSLWFIKQHMDPSQFSIDGVWSVFLAALVISIVQFVAHKVFA